MVACKRLYDFVGFAMQFSWGVVLFGGFVVCGFFCSLGVFFAVDTVHAFDYHKDNPGNNEKLNNILNEIAVGNHCFVAVAEEIWYVDGEPSEVYTSSK